MYEECVPTCGENCVLNEFQKISLDVYAKHLQVQKEAYLLKHPEVKQLIENLIVKILKKRPSRDIKIFVAQHFNRELEDMQLEVKDILRNFLDQVALERSDEKLIQELEVVQDVYLATQDAFTMAQDREYSSANLTQKSSSFLSIVTSASTLATPEDATPVATLSQELLQYIEHAIKVAGLNCYNEEELLYDTGYTFLKAAVEEAMEVPILPIKEDIMHMLQTALTMWETDAILKEQMAQQDAWARRERKPYKKLRRMLKDFKGYEPPDEEKVTPNIADTPKRPPGKFNRYARDVYGVYETTETFEKGNLTLSPRQSDIVSVFTIRTMDGPKSEASNNSSQ